MSKTGTYKVVNGEVVKVSDRVHTQSDVFMPRDTIHSGHYFENLGTIITSKEHKRQVMKEQNVTEA